MATEAEQLFENFCAQRAIPCRRIPEGVHKTPDFEITLGKTDIAVEVKQFEPNDEDRAFLEDLRTKGHAGGAVPMGRARPAMLDAMKQLRPYAKDRKAAIVVLYDTMGGTRGYLDSYSIAYCLYGPERVNYLVPNAPDQDVVYTGMSRGGGSVATARHNTTLSAVAVLGRSELGVLDLTVFHNIHAKIPLPAAECAATGLRQYRFASTEPGLMPEWIEIAASPE